MDHDPPPHEKRKHHRTGVTLLVEYDAPEELLTDYTDNLSTGGTFIATSRELEIGASVRLALSFPGLLEPVGIDGVVRWVREGDEPGVGIEFLEGEGRTRLAEVIERIRSKDPKTVSRLVRVLVVEDNPHVASFLGDGLTGSSRRAVDVSFHVRTAANGREALELLRSEPFDALIIDIYLPVIDGPHVIEKVRTALGMKHLPIIAVSAGGPGAREAALAAGADIFLDKPMRLRQIVETMRQLMKL
ncbi:MAG: response regulator [Kofleriaceae bacterium]|nr:MAG: response regulator [Kofleriaceae bacterium]MBZ0238423.1 response regulator [Kofleriaceae bacterium]